MSYSFRDRPRLSDRLRGKSGDELFKELRKELDQDREFFFDNPSSNWGTSAGSRFPRAGHPFDDPLMRHTDIRSHLEDLAQRHPEFADQLRYPAWSNENTNSSWGRKRRGSGQSDAGEASKHQPTDSVQPDSSDQPLRGRPKDNLRNTVPDMGQKQQETEDKESRGQRSWSAPPDNRTQTTEKPRFVSKIEIHPVNPDAPQAQTAGDATKPPMAPPKPQPQPQQQPQPQPQPHGRQSTVRHIPIFVEGRDEPVLPKNIEPEFTQTHAPPPQFSRPPPQPQYTAPPHHFQPQAPPRKQSTPPQFEQQTQPPPQHKPDPAPPEPEQPAAPAINPRDPLYRVECVQKEVDELKAKVENFGGSSRSDKEYILLDEMLTRNLIKLDDIETEGKDEVRAARKNTIKSIQRCISVLENKVPMPGGEKVSADSVEDGTSDAVQMDVEQQASKEQGSSDAPAVEEKKDTSDTTTEVVPPADASENIAV